MFYELFKYYKFCNLYIPSILGLWFYHNLIGCHRLLSRWFFIIQKFTTFFNIPINLTGDLFDDNFTFFDFIGRILPGKNTVTKDFSAVNSIFSLTYVFCTGDEEKIIDAGY